MDAPPATISRFGRYRVLRELGRGAMGVVYEAHDESIDRPVALKTMLLPEDPAERAEHEARFRQEARAAGGLSHPNVVTIHDLGREGEWLYIAMELLRGVELRQLMLTGSLPLEVAVDLAAQVAAGLAAAHAHGIVHRDIKPSNVMVLPGQHAKIMDFGVARMKTSELRTQAGVMLGSPKYMSPEQVGGGLADHRSDIFSLGSVLYEIATGVPAFHGADLANLLFHIVQAAPVPPRERHPGVPPELEAIILRAMHKEPALRYQDAAEMAQDLARCAAALGGPGQARRVVVPPPAAAYDLQLARTTVLQSPDPDPERTLPLGEAAPAGFPVAAAYDHAAAWRHVQAGAALPAQRGGRRGLTIWLALTTAAAVAAVWIALG
ncbi:MAG TPA: serine/threonine-protein kinase [Ramlibacter sp.]|jgi:serine/threonine-protein kinase|uniref:serine/threonine-protein kinase n=1 Tax=Ramlibacter sp. TaxID=1917967 RepID=UPI002D5C71E1|nr:serine/threonine-protein kinase [Ramlibacter sp.]HZY20208.1 serine/threonine-protein kinase [Ramlibacter sp.]